MVRGVRADRERQPMASHNRHDFHAFSALRWSDFRPATFGHNERRIDEAFFFIQRAVFAKLVGNVRQNPTQNLVAAPSLKASMHSLVVRIALRQHVPLRTCVENPQHRFEHMTGRDRLAPRTSIGNMLLGKMLPIEGRTAAEIMAKLPVTPTSSRRRRTCTPTCSGTASN